MQHKERSKAISISIILILILAVGILFYQNTKNKIEVETKLNELEIEMNEIRQEEEILKNEIVNQVEKDNISNSADMSEDDITIKEWKKFEFNTPVGETGKFEIYAEKAVQATGFSGASAHIYYLREGELYYHNQGDTDTKLASGITDLKQQGEDIIAVKGNDAKIYVENLYIQYQ